MRIPHTYFFYKAEHCLPMIVIKQVSVEKLFSPIVAREMKLSTKLVLMVSAIFVNLFHLKLKKIR